MNFLKKIKQLIADYLRLNTEQVEISYPPQIHWGDLVVSGFSLAKILNQPPEKIVQELAHFYQQSDQLKTMVSSVKIAGPYLNLILNDQVLSELVADSLSPKGWKKLLPPAVTLVEFLSPNTNKPLHLGHLRNAFLGDAIARILQAGGQQVIKANLINDRGIHICKSMLAWQKWAKGKTPQSEKVKDDHFVGQWYVRFNQEYQKNPELLDEAQVMLKKWEDQDRPTIKLWQTMTNWVLAGFKITLKKIGIKFDKIYFESKTFLLGKDILQTGLKKGIFKKLANGQIVFELPEKEFGLAENNQPKVTVLLRADGTSVYITQDIGLAVMKFKENKLNKSIHVVGSEQDYHFKCLFHILKALGYSWAKNCYHLSYGMVNLPEGKMKSREGKVVDADDLIEEMVKQTKKLLAEKQPELSLKELNRRAEPIAIGAMKYYFLTSSPSNDLIYDPAASISLDGNTGPYCQYAAARCLSLLDKAKKSGIKINQKIEPKIMLGPEERLAAQKIIQLPEKILASATDLDPSILARQIFEIAKAFNQFYNASPIIMKGADQTLINARLKLVQATLTAITEGLALLGITTLKKM